MSDQGARWLQTMKQEELIVIPHAAISVLPPDKETASAQSRPCKAPLWIMVMLIATVAAGSAGGVLARSGPSAEVRAGQMALMDSLIARQDWSEAAALGRNLLREDPEDPLYGWQIQGRLGLALHGAGDSAAAVPYLENAIRAAPFEPAHHLNLAAALMALDRPGRAMAEYREAVQLDPDNWRSRLDYGQVLLQLRMADAALPEIQLADSLCQRCPAAAHVLAGLFLQKQQPELATAYLERLWQAEPAPELRRTLATAYLQTERPADALAIMLPGWAADLSAEEKRIVLEADHDLGLTARALQMVAGLAAGSAPDDPLLWGLVSLICLEGGHLEQGLTAADRAIALDPDNPIYRNNKVVLLSRLGREEQARQEWQRVLQLAPELAEDEP